MENTTTVKVPKKYQHMIKLIEKDSEGYWAYSEDGFMFAGMGCHTAHEYNQKDLLSMIRTLTECECDECQEKQSAGETEVAESILAEAIAAPAQVEDLSQYVTETNKHMGGYRTMYRFPNGYGASVLVGGYGATLGVKSTTITTLKYNLDGSHTMIDGYALFDSHKQIYETLCYIKNM